MAKDTRKAGKKQRRSAVNGVSDANGEAFVVRALAKGLAMLSLFDAVHREWTLDEMVAELKLPRMTGYRMARTLQSRGLPGHRPAERAVPPRPGAPGLHLSLRGLRGARRASRGRTWSRSSTRRASRPRSRSTWTAWPCASTWSTPRGRTSARWPWAASSATRPTAHGKMYAAFMSAAEREQLLAVAASQGHPAHHHRPRGARRRAGPRARRRASPSTSRSATSAPAP